MAEVFALIFRYVYMYLWSTVVVAFITNVNDTCYSANVPVNSLYDISDEVCVLDNRTLTSTVYGSEQVWFVQFYSSWCGHCVHFAPTWKIFAEDIRGWQSIAKVAAVNCADQQNSKICSENIDVGFPTLRMFKALQKNGSGEINKGQRDVIHLRYALIDHVTKQNEEHRLPHWPMLSPVRVTWLLKALARFVKALQFIAVVFEDADSYAARELILDMINRKDVMVVRVLKQELINSLEATKWKVTRFPSLFIFKQSEEPTELLTSGKRDSLYSSLQAYLNQSSSLKMENNGQSNQKILASIMAIHVDEKRLVIKE